MSGPGHATIAGPRRLVDAPKPVFVRVFEYPQGYVGHTHRHRLAQVVYPIRGVVSVETRSGTWVVGQLTAVAIPPWRDHRVSAHGNASLRSVFIDPDAHPHLVNDVASIRVSTLLHELIREAGHRFTDFDAEDAVAVGVVSLIAELLPMMPTADSVRVGASDREPHTPSHCDCARRRPVGCNLARGVGPPPRVQPASSRPPLQEGHGCAVLDMEVVARRAPQPRAAGRRHTGDPRCHRPRLQHDERLHRDVQADHGPDPWDVRAGVIRGS